MSTLKKLAGQTAIYGLSSILGRFLNYGLVPLHTAVFNPEQFGVVSEMYAYVAFLIILLTFGMETAFFRFTTKGEHRSESVFSTSFIAVGVVGILFIINAILFSQSIADWLKYPNNQEYVAWFAIIITLDAIASIPLAKLRKENKALQFVGVNLANVGVNVGLNALFLLVLMPMLQESGESFLVFTPETGVGYIFIANLVASSIKFLLLIPAIGKLTRIDFGLLKRMLSYSAPLLIAGLAGMVNETLDRILLKQLLYDTRGHKETMSLIGIYGACYKISIVITLMIQAFRYAAEPFFFSQEKEKGSRELYAKIMDYFVWAMATTFLGVMLFLDLFKFMIQDEAFWVGLKVVPVLLLANIFLGIYYNQSVWYKLSGKTIWGAYLAIFGATITLVINFVYIPEFDYMASAYATLACYGSMMVASYFLGQKFYPVPYSVLKNIGMVVLAVVTWILANQIPVGDIYVFYAIRMVILLAFLGVSYFIFRPTKRVI